MTDPSKIPSDPLSFIKRNVRRRSIFWTYHVSMRHLKRGITRDLVLATVDTYAVIESYPDDKYFPSYLVLGTTLFVPTPWNGTRHSQRGYHHEMPRLRW